MKIVMNDIWMIPTAPTFWNEDPRLPSLEPPHLSWSRLHQLTTIYSFKSSSNGVPCLLRDMHVPVDQRPRNQSVYILNPK